jgi:hypothetical protein
MLKFLLSIVLVFVSIQIFACNDELPPALDNLTTGYHVFGIQADPPEVKPDGQVKLTVFDYHPKNQKAVSYQWRVCFSAKNTHFQEVGLDFECADQELDFPLTAFDPSITIDLGPTGFNFKSLYQGHAIRYPNSQGKVPTLAEGVDIWVILESGVPTEPDQKITTIKKIKITDKSTELRKNPKISKWTISETGLRNPSKPCVQERDRFDALLAGEMLMQTQENNLDPTINIDPTAGDPTECVVHSLGRLKVDLDVLPFDSGDSLIYGFYNNLPVGFDTVLSTKDAPNSTIQMTEFIGRSRELFLMVRDDFGGFDLIRQKLNVIRGYEE